MTQRRVIELPARFFGLRLRLFVIPLISITPDRRNILRLAGFFFDLHANAADIDIDNFIIAEIAVAPDMVQNAGTIQCCILVIEEILHDLVFHLCQVNQLAVFGDGAAFQIQGKWAAFDHRRLFVLDKAHADTAIDRVHSVPRGKTAL